MYKVKQTGAEVQDVLDDVQNKTDVATQVKNGYMSKGDKKKLDELEEPDILENWEIENIWNSINV